jgi:hypothetical protein
LRGGTLREHHNDEHYARHKASELHMNSPVNVAAPYCDIPSDGRMSRAKLASWIRTVMLPTRSKVSVPTCF